MFRSDALTIAPMASTGPHSEECGEIDRLGFALHGKIGFNGAALRRVRRVENGSRVNSSVALQRGRTPKSAERNISLAR